MGTEYEAGIQLIIGYIKQGYEVSLQVLKSIYKLANKPSGHELDEMFYLLFKHQWF